MTGLNSEMRQQVEELLHAGHSDCGIHQATGVARTTIARYRKRLGLPGYLVTADSPACRHGHPFPENVGHYPNGTQRSSNSTPGTYRPPSSPNTSAAARALSTAPAADSKPPSPRMTKPRRGGAGGGGDVTSVGVCGVGEDAFLAEGLKRALVEVHADDDGHALAAAGQDGRLVEVAGLLDRFGERVAYLGDGLLVLLLRRAHVGSVPHDHDGRERDDRYDVHERDEVNRATKEALVPHAQTQRGAA